MEESDLQEIAATYQIKTSTFVLIVSDIFYHSYRSESAGLVPAAFRVCDMTVIHAITRASMVAVTKIQIFSSTAFAGSLSAVAGFPVWLGTYHS